MKTSVLPGYSLPYVIQPESNDASKETLATYIKANKEELTKHYYKNGALLLRGFELNTPKDFEDIALLFDARLKNDYYGTSPRNIVKNTNYIYTASELPGYYPIMQHCEMSYVKHPPIGLFFYCHIEPDYGGETPLCDFRKVYEQMDASIKDEFETKGVLTVRNYSGFGKQSKFNLFELKKWNEIFNTTEEKLKAHLETHGTIPTYILGNNHYYPVFKDDTNNVYSSSFILHSTVLE